MGSRSHDQMGLSEQEIEAVYAARPALRRGPAALRSAPLFAPRLGMDAPLAVRSPDGRYLVYHPAPGGAPALRIVDTRTGDDRLLAGDAQLVAWGRRIVDNRSRPLR